MTSLQLFLPCAAGAESYLAHEVQRILACSPQDVRQLRGGVQLTAAWTDALRLNLHSRLAQRVLVQLVQAPYQSEQHLYDAAFAVPWELWFTHRQSIKVEITAQHSPLRSLNFAALKIKDAVCDRFRDIQGARPNVDTQHPDVRLYAHLTSDRLTLYIDTSGEPLFKRGWRVDKGDAPLKETLAAAMLAASGWADSTTPRRPLYDPCCGSGTIAIEAAQIACEMAPGLQRHFGFEKLLPFETAEWQALKVDAASRVKRFSQPLVFGSDVSHRMVDFAQRNAERAGVSAVVQFRGGDALQRMPPTEQSGLMLVNPPYGERIEAGGFAGRGRFGARELPQTQQDGDFFDKLAAHWKKYYAGWTAWVLSPDQKLPGKMRLKATRRVPMWNGPLECRLFRFDLVAGKMAGPTLSHESHEP